MTFDVPPSNFMKFTSNFRWKSYFCAWFGSETFGLSVGRGPESRVVGLREKFAPGEGRHLPFIQTNTNSYIVFRAMVRANGSSTKYN